MESDFATWLMSDGKCDDELYSQEPSDWVWITTLVKDVEVFSARGAMPFVAEGLIQGLPFLYLEEAGIASLKIGEEGEYPAGEHILYSSSMDCYDCESGRDFNQNFIVLLNDLSPASREERKWADLLPYVSRPQKLTTGRNV